MVCIKRAVFYDLETSDKDPIGQILNYCFIETDLDFNVLSSVKGEVEISRLQLPRAKALLANKIDVLCHQEGNVESERDAMAKIHRFMVEVSRRGAVSLIGYNSSKFDLSYLRTSLIRNGLNPYISNLFYGDLLHLSQKLCVCRKDFPRKELCREDNPKKLSLSLENLAKHFGILTGAQAHESYEDVMLTVKLAKAYKEMFGIHIAHFDGYEPRFLHNKEGVGKIVLRAEPEYDLTVPDAFKVTPYMLLNFDRKYSLWVDLDAFERGERALRLVKVWAGDFFLATNEVQTDKRLLSLAKEALSAYSSARIDNYFSDPLCDIEQHIYMMDFDGISQLERVIWKGGDERELEDEFARSLYVRYKLANYKPSDGVFDSGFMKAFKRYCEYRYGGKMRLDKGESFEDILRGEKREPRYHPTLDDLFEEIDSEWEEASEEGKRVLASLREFYDKSLIVTVMSEA